MASFMLCLHVTAHYIITEQTKKNGKRYGHTTFYQKYPRLEDPVQITEVCSNGTEQWTLETLYARGFLILVLKY